MAFQPSLFIDDASADASGLIARARHTDPDTSHDAADSFERRGRANTDRDTILSLLRKTRRRMTGAEIANELGGTWENTRVMRRMKELEVAGLVKRSAKKRTCTIKGSAMYDYWAAN